MPSPIWANAVPQAERGSPRARANAVDSGTFSKAVRSTRSVSAPTITNTASPMANGTRTGPPPSAAKVTAVPITASAAAPTRRCATPSRSPRFQASSGPNGAAISSGRNSGPNVRLKNGAPTEILSPVSASSASG